MSDSSGSSPGWYPDPFGRHEFRYFNGASWTSDVADGGQRFVDPYGTTPAVPTLAAHPSYPRTSRGNGLATAAMTCGIVAVLLALLPFLVVIGIVLAILAIVFGIRGLRRSSIVGAGRGFAITGIATGSLALAASVAGIAFTVVVWNAVEDFAEPGPVDVVVTDCRADGRRVEIAGELTNRSDIDRDYTLFVRVTGGSEILTLDAVEPDETVRWDVRLRASRSVVSCEPDVVVQGPLPFGVEIDPIDS